MASVVFFLLIGLVLSSPNVLVKACEGEGCGGSGGGSGNGGHSGETAGTEVVTVRVVVIGEVVTHVRTDIPISVVVVALSSPTNAPTGVGSNPDDSGTPLLGPGLMVSGIVMLIAIIVILAFRKRNRNEQSP